MKNFEFGVYSLGECIPDAQGHVKSARERVEDILQIARWADEAQLDVFGVGEHHRLDLCNASCSRCTRNEAD